ncbi:hypothetical protein [Flavobacterium sp.]|uniref:hypothetical protein n=1 Tax=Flavobacterium sp. TaxID=239 RepID=UPI003422EEAA
MRLFDDHELFLSGTQRKTFDVPDAELLLDEGFFSKTESDEYYEHLFNRTPWREFEMDLYDKTVKVPRMVAWYEDKTNVGADPDGLDWTTELLEIRSRVEKETGIAFNSVLLNLYRDGRWRVLAQRPRRYDWK